MSTPQRDYAEPPLGQWWKRFSRVDVLADLEQALGRGLDPNDPLPDTLIANAQALGLMPAELRMWIYDEPARGDWDMRTLTQWAREYGLGTAPEAPEPAG